MPSLAQQSRVKFYLVIGFNNTGPCGFKLQALEKGVIMQTNRLLQQYVLAGQNPVSSYCLMPPNVFAWLFCHHIVAPYWHKPKPAVGRKALGALKSLNQYLSLEKGAKSLFFPLSFGGFEALFKGALMLLPQCNSKVLINFFSVQQHLQSVDRWVSSFSRDHRKIKKNRK